LEEKVSTTMAMQVIVNGFICENKMQMCIVGEIFSKSVQSGKKKFTDLSCNKEKGKPV